MGEMQEDLAQRDERETEHIARLERVLRDAIVVQQRANTVGHQVADRLAEALQVLEAIKDSTD